jgi:hypothetical protein
MSLYSRLSFFCGMDMYEGLEFLLLFGLLKDDSCWFWEEEKER